MSAWNRDDIIRMAREAGLTVCRDEWVFGEMLERFAALVAAHKTEVAIAEAYRCGHEAGVVEEREACLKIIQSYMDDSWIGDDAWNLARDVLNDIKARGAA